ncbi:MAG: adenylate/guanylate cyclase domain-containing protein, partial [Acidobacteriota bacterium]
LEAWNLIRRSTGERELQHGIGIHSGMVLAGNIGSTERMSYSLVGDAVNVASRIETLNKQFGSCILVSSATRDQLADASKLQALSSVLVKGRSAEVQVFRLA